MILAMFAEERRKMISKLLTEQRRVETSELSTQFNVSIDTVRRDLSIMEDRGMLIKTHGGAIPTAPQLFSNKRYEDGTEEENSISKAAVSMIQEDDVIFLASAGIQYGMIKFLSQDMKCTIITNSLAIASKLKDFNHIDTYIVGGKVRPSGNVYDSFAVENIKSFMFDKCFISGGKLSIKGVSTSTFEVASLLRAVINNSRRSICMAPLKKIGDNEGAMICPLENINTIITSSLVQENKINELKGFVSEIIIV